MIECTSSSPLRWTSCATCILSLMKGPPLPRITYMRVNSLLAYRRIRSFSGMLMLDKDNELYSKGITDVSCMIS